MGKRTIALLLTVILVIGFIPLHTYAAEITGDGYSFDSGSGTLTITSDNGTTNWKNDPDIESGSVKKLVIENSVTAIQPSAFWYCDSLITVTIPDSVYSIGNYAFECCSSLVAATFLGSTAPSLGTAVFSAVKSGFRIYYPEGGTGYDSLGYTYYSSPVTGSGYSFNPATGVLTISSNSGTTNWRSGSRIPITIVTSLVVEEGVTSIAEYAFAYCSSLLEADLPDSLTSLGADAFDGTALTEIIIPNGVTAIPEWAFYSCQSLSSVTIPDGVTFIGDNAFTYCPLTTLNLPQNLTTIGTQAFYACRSLETLIIPDEVTDIGTQAFFCCDSLREITFPAGVTSIGASAFAACTSLTSATFKGMSAPTFGTNVFTKYAEGGVTIYYPAGGTGYDSLGYPAVPIADTTPPVAPVILSPTDGSTISTNLPMFTGTAEAESTVTIFLDGISAGTAAAGTEGNWSFTPAAALTDGTHNVKATATDTAGNVSADSNVSAFTVDTTPPSVSVTSVTVKAAPTKTTYTEGESLDLTGLVVILHKSNSTSEEVAFADFGTKGITVSPANGTTLSTSDTAVTITYTTDSKSVSQSITVTLAPAEDNDPTISPASINYNLDAPADVCTTITWNSASTVTDVVYGATSLTTPDVYVVSGSALTIRSSYLDTLGLVKGDKLEFEISFDKGSPVMLAVNIVDSSTIPASHSITVENDGHGTANAGAASASAGAEIVLTATPDDGYRFKEWQVISPIGLTITGDTFTMPDEAVTVKAIFEETPATNYTLTVNGSYASGSGKGSYVEGATVTINAGSRSNYTFSGWSSGDGVTFANANSATTTFTMPAKNVTVTAAWSYNGGGGGSTGGGGSSGDGSAPSTPTYNADVKAGNGSETTLPVTVEKDAGTASIDTGSLSLAQGGTVITIPSIPDVDAYLVDIPVPDLSTTDVQGTLSINTDTGSVTVTSNMLTGVSGISGSKAEIAIGQGDKSTLPGDVRAAIGDKPLISLSLSIDSKQTDWTNPNAPVTVNIPYTPTAAELANPESIIVWYIDGSGNVVTIPNGRYDPASGIVIFFTTHFSDYAVAYNKLSFNDVAVGAWYKKAVNFIAARGITGGIGNGNYSPNAKLTRGDFLVLLMKSYGIAADANPTDNFSDAGNTYYTGYLAAAKRLGISSGVGNNMYAPGNEITRQEMFTLLYDVLKTIGQLPEGNSGKTLSDFTDAGQIDLWAKDAIALLVETGTVGGNNGALTPLSTTTRAEMAQVLYNLLGE